MKIRLLKVADALAGPAAALLLPSPPRGEGRVAPRSALFIRPGGIGDAVLLVPALLAFIKAHPGCAVDLLAEKRNAQVFPLAPGVRRVLCYDEPGGLLAALKGRYDLVVDTEQSYRLSAVVARLCRAPFSVGFGGNERGRLFSASVPYRQDLHEAQSFLSLLEPLEIGAKGVPIPFLEIPADAALSSRSLLHPLGGRRYVCLFPGASIPEKRWGTERFREVALELCSRGFAVAVIGGGGEAPQGEAIVAGTDGVNLAGQGSLAVTAAIIAAGEALVTGDSGVLHLAYGLGTPTVSLFGPSSALKWAPPGGLHEAVSFATPCAPCARFGTVPPCSRSVRCMDGITVGQVMAAFDRVLSR